jgi:murein DD-endopeptidase MepM/ murein hydrolase activator NlpD
MLRWLLAFILLAGLVAGGAFIAAGRTVPPSITIDRPERVVGQQGELQVSVQSPDGALQSLSITLQQNGASVPLFALDAPQSAAVSAPAADVVRVVRPFGKAAVPQLQQGTATIQVVATRASFLNLRQRSTTVTKDVRVLLEPPRISVLSTHHYLNHGGAEMIVYRATPPEAQSGVRVGEIEYAGFPASGAGVATSDPALKVAFFALLHDQDVRTPVVAFARDEAGNEATATHFIDNVFEKPFKRSRIAIDDRFLSRVVPEILEHSPAITAKGDLVADFLQENGPLRQMNADTIAALTAATSPTRLWEGAFAQLGNSQVEANFADHRTYVYGGKEIDQQTHLGFDLAVTSRVPLAAANAGVVVNASWLGIYGNCVIIDHGMGVASLYGHLSSIDVKVGDRVAKGQILGRSGMTGLAGGDHLHFTMLVGGRPVNPVEWWDAHWVEDRVERKLREVNGAAPSS